MTMLNIEIGSKLFCNWGAMFPTEEYTIVEIDGEKFVAENEEQNLEGYVHDIRAKNTVSANGSPIGIFLKNA